MIVDLRSDTVTKPSPGMLKAMFDAQVGDDVFREDPTVNELEEKTAKLFGMEAGLFCPSGTMTNQVAIKVHTQPGDEVLCDATSHIYNYEGGGIAFNSGAQAKLIQGEKGRIAPQQVIDSINPSFDWLTRTSLLSIENTANRAGGSFYSLQQMQELSSVSKKHQLKFHLDGARIFNAMAAMMDSSQKISELTIATGKCFDSISVCLSKGLGTPTGSVLIGDTEFIRKARRVRKVFGGGMRQAGFLAAAGIYALDNNIARLADDHSRAKKLAEVLQTLSCVDHIIPVETNIIIFTLNDKMKAEDFVSKLAVGDIKASPFGKQMIRFVTHLDFDDAMLQKVSEVLKKI